MTNDNAQLVIDEELYLQAVKTLAELEDAGESFELLNVVGRVYAAEDYLAERFAADVGEEIAPAVKHAIERYVAAVYLVSHHRAKLGDIGEIREEFAGATLDFIRSAAWAFLTAWTHRYGGLHARLAKRGTLIDPSVDDVK